MKSYTDLFPECRPAGRKVVVDDASVVDGQARLRIVFALKPVWACRLGKKKHRACFSPVVAKRI